MKINGIDLNQIVEAIKSLAIMIIGLVLTFILLGTVMRATGHPVPYLPAMDPTQLCYLMGGWYLFRK